MLKLTIKPEDSIFIGGSVVKNMSDSAIDIGVLTKAPILRAAQILKPEDANTPCKRVYLQVQNMYMFEKHEREDFTILQDMMNEIVAAAPSTGVLIAEIGDLVARDEFYKALTATTKLINYEAQLLAGALSANTPEPQE